MADQVPPARLVVLGAQGQVGWELVRALAPLGRVEAHDRSSIDLTDEAALRSLAVPTVILNAAAYTAVDKAESEPELATLINAHAPRVLAEVAEAAGALLVHYSTDYVFDGTATRPYVETDAPSPRTAYGKSKLAGDEAVLASGAEAYVFRVGWVYGSRGRNFLATMRRLAAERDELRVVDDQHGAPTWSRAIAAATAQAVEQWLTARRLGQAAPVRGVYHLAAPDHTTWHGFASEIVRALPAAGTRPKPTVQAITTAEFPTPAPRPRWSVLDSSLARRTFGIALSPWREQLAQCLAVTLDPMETSSH